MVFIYKFLVTCYSSLVDDVMSTSTVSGYYKMCMKIGRQHIGKMYSQITLVIASKEITGILLYSKLYSLCV